MWINDILNIPEHYFWDLVIHNMLDTLVFDDLWNPALFFKLWVKAVVAQQSIPEYKC